MSADITTSLEALKADLASIKNILSEGLPETLTADEVADLFKISRITVWKWDRKGLLKPHRAGKRKLYKRSEVMELLK